MIRIRKPVVLLAVSLLIFAVSGCATTAYNPALDETGAAQQGLADISGSYNLAAVNGAAMPATVTHGNAQIKVHSGLFVIRADGTCTSKSVFSPPSGGKVTRVAHASYTRKGSNLVMQWQGAGVNTGTIDGDTFTMDNHGMIFRYSRSGEVDDAVGYDQARECGSAVAAAKITKARAGVFDDFDSGLRFGTDTDGRPIGFITFSDSERSSASISTTSDHPRRPGEADDNEVLQLDLDVKAWAGVVHNFENESVSAWVPRDWRGFNEFSFWLYGHNKGTSLYVEILDNRKPCPASAGAELYTYMFTDNFSGWQLITVAFEQLARKEVGNNAPNDGLGLSEVHGWALGALNTDGPVTYYIDDFQLR